MAEFTLCGKTVGNGHPVYIIAEACDNHMGSVETAKKMIDGAKRAGADGIKFQHHLPDEEMLPEIPMSDNFEEPLYEFLKKYALSLDDHIELRAYCAVAGIDYLCTPFSYRAAEELKSIGVDFFKIGSGEMTDLASLELISALGNPMLLSTGMCTLDEIRETYHALKAWGAEFAFLNCVSEYPPEYGDMNLGVITLLQKEFPNTVIGHSDHTPDLFTSFAAVALGAKIIEKHIILDKKTPGPDQSVSIDMSDLAELVDGIRKIEAALGSRKRVQEREKQIREWAFRSVVSTRDIPAGTVLSREMLCTKRPGTGIPSKDLPSLVGKKTRNSIGKNTLVKKEDIIW
ncbi:MAG: CMP-N-acetylneuraminic acid synthetase [Methanoculleus sp. SDB]|nr:MAG: CMP-N-acetylneuraminic acid synthetase [Methanoculleus sp. SDB]